jgi:hypothetical protein
MAKHKRVIRKSIVVKVQITIVTNAPVGEAEVLVYNQDRSVQGMFLYTAELKRTLRGKLKSFWFAHTIPDPKVPNGYIVSLDRPAPWQEW